MLAADARGTISSREIAFACEQNVVFMALSARVDAGKQVLPAEMRDKEEKAIKAPEEKIATLDNEILSNVVDGNFESVSHPVAG